jgi:hypothetical protein
MGFEERVSPRDLWKSGKNGCSDYVNRGDAIEKVFFGHSETLCNVTSTGLQFLFNSFEDRKKNFYVKGAVLKKELGEPIPACSKELASKLNDKMKMSFRAAIDAVKQGKSSELLNPPFNARDFEGVN